MVGHHLHFISADRSHGGHLLDCSVARATVKIEEVDDLLVELPPGVPLPQADDSEREAQLRRAESAH